VTPQGSALTGSLCVFLAAVGFSAKSVIVKLAYAYHVDAATLMALRMGFSLPFFLALTVWSVHAEHLAPLGRREWTAVLGLGFLGYYLAAYLDLLGLQYITASLERLILFLFPTIVVVLSAWLFKRRVTGLQILALVLSYAGIILVFLENLQHAGAGRDLTIGGALVFTSAVAYSFYLIGSGEVVGRIGAIRFTAYAMSAACVLVFVQFLTTHRLRALELPRQVYWLSFIMAVTSTVLPAVLMTEGLRRVGANQAAMIGTIGPVVTMVLGLIFLGEPITVVQVVGAALVLGGVTWVTIKGKTRGAMATGRPSHASQA
jgi:drug/metabolite transporter (DMT)-like permease